MGLENGDDAAVVRLDERRAVVATADFFTPVVDDPLRLGPDRGRQRALRRLRDGRRAAGRGQPARLAARRAARSSWRPRCCAGERRCAAEAGCHLAGGHSIDDREPKYGLAVTGLADPDRLLRNDAGRAGVPLTLTKPLGLGILNNRHKATGETFPEAVEVMTALNRDASRAALAAGHTCATDVTGFGLLGHLLKLCRASGVDAVLDAAAVPVPGRRPAPRSPTGYVPGGSRRNLDWVRPHLDRGGARGRAACCSPTRRPPAGCWWPASCPGYPVVGELVPAGDAAISVR